MIFLRAIACMFTGFCSNLQQLLSSLDGDFYRSDSLLNGVFWF